MLYIYVERDETLYKVATSEELSVKILSVNVDGEFRISNLKRADISLAFSLIRHHQKTKK